MSVLQPEFFDIFGFLGFLYIVALSVRVLQNKNLIPRWMFLILLGIGIVGLLVDGAIVYSTYLR